MSPLLIESVRVENVQHGDVIRFRVDEPWVTALKVKADRHGFDLLYAPFGGQPRWRGFDVGDTVERRTGDAAGTPT